MSLLRTGSCGAFYSGQRLRGDDLPEGLQSGTPECETQAAQSPSMYASDVLSLPTVSAD